MISGEIPYIIYPRRSIFPTFVRLATGNLNSPDSTVNHPHQVTKANGVLSLRENSITAWVLGSL